jgi:uncharacterized small protein (TIGR04563 family)
MRMYKICVKLPQEMLEELKEETIRQDRNRNWIMQRAWMFAKSRIRLISTHKESP